MGFISRQNIQINRHAGLDGGYCTASLIPIENYYSESQKSNGGLKDTLLE